MNASPLASIGLNQQGNHYQLYNSVISGPEQKMQKTNFSPSSFLKYAEESKMAADIPMEVEASKMIPESEREKADDNYSKECLKFCRKIATLISEKLNLRSAITQKIFKFNSQLLSTYLHALGRQPVEASLLNELQTECLIQLWSKFKAVMSYSKNKKICIVKQEQWNLIFQKETFVESLKEICERISMSWIDPVAGDALKDLAFREIFSRMLFSTNKLLTLALILTDSSSKGKYLRDLGRIESFVLLIVFPEYFQYYNHRRGKFALECCGKCKVCCSKSIPADFLSLLDKARADKEQVASFIGQGFANWDNKSYYALVSLMAYTFNRF